MIRSPSRSLCLWIAFFLVESTVGFAPIVLGPDIRTTNGPFVRVRHANANPNARLLEATTTQLHWSRWFAGSESSKNRKAGQGGKKLVQLIAMDDDGTEKDPTDVYVSPVNGKDSEALGENVIDVPATREVPQRPEFSHDTDFDVVVVGAGCAGIGTALMLTRTFGLGADRVLVVEQGKHVGESFRHWPEEMRFISPSFNQQGWTNSFDLNAIHYDTSPAFTLRSEHPTGEEYAIYLESIAEQAKLRVSLETKVISIREDEEGDEHYPGPFHVQVSQGETTKTLSTRYIVWAAGEFQFPRDRKSESGKDGKDGGDEDDNPTLSFPGADLCLHNSQVRSWAKLDGDDFVIIGGYESGIDAAVNLAKAGKKCKVVASTPCWNLKTGDPSSELAPYTSDRLRSVLKHNFSPQPQLFAPLRVIAVDKLPEGEYGVAARWKSADDAVPPSTYGPEGFRAQVPGDAETVKVFRTKHPPILCTGFEGSVSAQAGHLFAFPDPNAKKKACVGDGPLLTREDESTKVQGVFLVGPMVSHGDLSFCFVYKFRQRFAVVANAICQGLGMDTEAAVRECRQTNMYLDDFLTCQDTCGDAC